MPGLINISGNERTDALDRLYSLAIDGVILGPTHVTRLKSISPVLVVELALCCGLITGFLTVHCDVGSLTGIYCIQRFKHQLNGI